MKTVKEELISSVLSTEIAECKSILKMIVDEQFPNIDKLIQKLEQLVKDAEKLRRDILISKTAGTSATVLGSVLTVIGIALTPFTLGISTVVLPAVGGSFIVSGAVTNIGASIADGCLSREQGKQISQLLEELLTLQDDCDNKVKRFLKKVEEREILIENSRKTYERQLDITKWLQNGHLHRDEKVQPNELRKGDHIYRAIRGLPGTYHHAIYISDEMVVEFINEETCVQTRSLKAFTENKLLHRRDYRGFALSTDETIKLTEEAKSLSNQYNLITYNCEHFATFMKLKVNWSSQVNTSLRMTREVAQNIARPISLIVDGAEIGARISAAVVSNVSREFFSFFTSAPAPVMSTLAKASIVIAPISIAIDITSLVYAYKEENTSVETCNQAIKSLTERKSYLKERAIHLIELMDYINVRRLEALRIEEEQEQKRFEALQIEIEQIRLEALQIEQDRIRLFQIQEERRLNSYFSLSSKLFFNIFETTSVVCKELYATMIRYRFNDATNT